MPIKVVLTIQLDLDEKDDFTEKASELLDELDDTVARLGHECVMGTCDLA